MYGSEISRRKSLLNFLKVIYSKYKQSFLNVLLNLKLRKFTIMLYYLNGAHKLSLMHHTAATSSSQVNNAREKN